MHAVRWPLLSTLVEAARMYALDSVRHTFDFPGWEDEARGDAERKMKRIMHGRLAQLWLAEWCRINEVPFRHDATPFFASDSGDLEIVGNKVDAKATTVGLLQVGAQLRRQQGWFAFTELDENLEWIGVKGLIPCEEFFEKAVYVKHNDRIPGTNFVQKYREGSYFLLDARGLVPFPEIVQTWVAEREAAGSPVVSSI